LVEEPKTAGTRLGWGPWHFRGLVTFRIKRIHVMFLADSYRERRYGLKWKVHDDRIGSVIPEVPSSGLGVLWSIA